VRNTRFWGFLLTVFPLVPLLRMYGLTFCFTGWKMAGPTLLLSQLRGFALQRRLVIRPPVPRELASLPGSEALFPVWFFVLNSLLRIPSPPFLLFVPVDLAFFCRVPECELAFFPSPRENLLFLPCWIPKLISPLRGAPLCTGQRSEVAYNSVGQ